MKKIKLVFGTVFALLLSVSLLVPANISAAEEPVAEEPVVEPAPLAAATDLQAAFDAKYPNGIPEGQMFYLSDLFATPDTIAAVTNDDETVNSVYYMPTILDIVAVLGEVPTEEDLAALEPLYAYYGIDKTEFETKSGLIMAYQAGHVSYTVVDITTGETYTLEFDVTETATDFVMNPSAVTLNVGESKDIMIETDPINAWWFWDQLLEDTGASSIDLTYEISDTSIIDVQEITDAEGLLDGFTVTALKAGTATITVNLETEAGNIAIATITVKAPAPAKPAPTPKPSVAPKAPVSAAPATGDTTNTAMYALMMLVALVGMGGYAVLKKQK